jgi:hypothetical protein
MKTMPHTNSSISNISSSVAASPQHQDDDDHQLFFVTSYSDFDKLGEFDAAASSSLSAGSWLVVPSTMITHVF